MKEFQKTISELDITINTMIDQLKDKYEGKTTLIPSGIYKGRWGQVEGIHYDKNFKRGGRIVSMIRPHRMDGQEGLLWDRVDARTFWEVPMDSVFYNSLEEALNSR